jgi:hypothetical protein
VEERQPKDWVLAGGACEFLDRGEEKRFNPRLAFSKLGEMVLKGQKTGMGTLECKGGNWWDWIPSGMGSTCPLTKFPSNVPPSRGSLPAA